MKTTWWDGNSTRVWRLFLIGYMSILGFFGTWVFTTLTEIPKDYSTKSEVIRLCDRMDTGFNRLSDKIDTLYNK